MKKLIISVILFIFLGLGLWTIKAPQLEAQSGWRHPVPCCLTAGSLIYARDGNTFSPIDAVATGQVLTSAGTSTVPAYSASPSITGLTLSGDLTANGNIVGDAATTITGVAAATFSGLLTGSADALLSGTTPQLTIGDAGAEDTQVVFDGAAQDFYVALEDATDDLVIGLGSTAGTTPALMIDQDQEVSIIHRKHWLDTGNITLTLADCGSIRMIATDAKTYTLPDTSVVGPGCEYTFINTGADDAVLLTVTPDDAVADGIFGTIAAVSMTGTDDGDLTNTKSGANQGDWAKIVSDGVTGWFIIGGDGVWNGA